MASTDAELEQQLMEAGKQLSYPPASIDELIPVLDNLEKLLLKVDQAPKKSMLDSLKPSMKALIHDGLLRHLEVDVKVAVASCISEIMRITAPDTLYNDDQMRDVFQLIVSSFEDLADQSSRSYIKRALILETVSKVRSCVIMLDLECDALIVEMFEHFLKSVRDYHLYSIYSSMENIMVLILEESEEISIEMLKPLLASVKKDNEGVLPIARKLGEGVLLKSAAKLKPYIMPALISLGDTKDNYSQVVASVCEGTAATFEHNDENASGVQLVVREGPSLEEGDPTVDRSPKSVMSNGVNVTGNGEASVEQESSKKPEEDVSQHLNLTGKEDIDDSDADKLAKAESERGQKSDTAINSVEPSDSSHVECEKEAEKPPDTQISGSKDIVRSSDSPVKDSSNEVVIPSEVEKDSDDQEVKTVVKEVKLPATGDEDEKPLRKSSKRSKSTKQSGKKVSAGDLEAKKPKHSDKKTKSESDAKKPNLSDSDDKPLKPSSRKGEKKGVKEEEGDSDTKPLKLSAKNGNTSNSGDVKSAKETPTTSSKRKRTTNHDKVSDTIRYDKRLVGLKVKVFWPNDDMYYEGVIESFDSARKKHKVSYVDGEEEILNLKKQKWEILKEFSVRDEEQPTKAQSEEASPETHKKKSKTNSAPSASQEKIKDSAKRVGGASSSGRSKGPAAKSQKTVGKLTDGKSKEDEETLKATTKTNKSKGNTNGTRKAKSGSPNAKESGAVKTSESAETGKKQKKRS